MAETWITITSDNLRKKLSAGEWDTFTTAALTPGVTSVVADVIRSVVGRVQGAVRASGQHTVGPPGTVPPELESATWDLLQEELAARIPESGIVFDDLRKGRIRRANELLERVEAGKLKRITEPETPSATAPAADGGAYGGDCKIDFSKLR